MRIKWRDLSQGLADFSRWESISRDKALNMMQRAAPGEYEFNVHCLAKAEEVRLPLFMLHEDNSKHHYWPQP